MVRRLIRGNVGRKKNCLKYGIYIVDNEKIDELKLRKNESPVEKIVP